MTIHQCPIGTRRRRRRKKKKRESTKASAGSQDILRRSPIYGLGTVSKVDDHLTVLLWVTPEARCGGKRLRGGKAELGRLKRPERREMWSNSLVEVEEGTKDDFGAWCRSCGGAPGDGKVRPRGSLCLATS
jgi:hypothetical protein